MASKKMSLAQKVNILRASVMWANDGIISIAGIVIGVAAATNNAYSILISGLSLRLDRSFMISVTCL